MTKLNLYGVMSDHVEFATASKPGLVTMPLDMWKAMGKPFILMIGADEDDTLLFLTDY